MIKMEALTRQGTGFQQSYDCQILCGRLYYLFIMIGQNLPNSVGQISALPINAVVNGRLFPTNDSLPRQVIEER